MFTALISICYAASSTADKSEVKKEKRQIGYYQKHRFGGANAAALTAGGHQPTQVAYAQAINGKAQASAGPQGGEVSTHMINFNF